MSLLLLIALIAGQDKDTRDVKTLVAELAADDLAQRDVARSELLRRGPAIRAELEPFLASDAPDIQAAVPR